MSITITIGRREIVVDTGGILAFLLTVFVLNAYGEAVLDGFVDLITGAPAA